MSKGVAGPGGRSRPSVFPQRTARHPQWPSGEQAVLLSMDLGPGWPCPNSTGCCLAPSAAGPFPTVGFSPLLQARRQFQSQLADLQQLPDILKITEAKLAECQDQLQGYERKNIDLTAIISDLRSRVREWQKGTHELTRSGVRLPR